MVRVVDISFVTWYSSSMTDLILLVQLQRLNKRGDSLSKGIEAVDTKDEIGSCNHGLRVKIRLTQTVNLSNFSCFKESF